MQRLQSYTSLLQYREKCSSVVVPSKFTARNSFFHYRRAILRKGGGGVIRIDDCVSRSGNWFNYEVFLLNLSALHESIRLGQPWKLTFSLDHIYLVQCFKSTKQKE